ncbi:MAG: glycosyltransferase family 2 protein [Clostridia bacterium]|nr:glycosyltransferase family 2 protein [Clostridia bacterium]
MKISVAMAAYNGEKYIGEQIESILPQLREGDELIVSDDNPAGKTRSIVEFYTAYDNRVKYVEGEGKGVCKNFENAINHCSGDVIFLCDQDDVWLDGKVQKVLNVIEAGADVVLHDAQVTDGELNVTSPSFFALNGSKPGFVKNLVKNSYMGCCMAFKAEFKNIFMPFPENLPMHDWWIGLNAELRGKVAFLHEPLIKHRCHGGNVTGGETTAVQKLLWRLQMTADIIRSK